jgi:hypothetical protein
MSHSRSNLGQGVANRRSEHRRRKAAHGACTIGWVIPSSARKSVRGHMGRHTPSLRRAHRFVGACSLTRLLEQGSCFGGFEGLGRDDVLDAATARSGERNHRGDPRILHLRDQQEIVLAKREI